MKHKGGRPKVQKLEKEQARKVLRERVFAQMAPLVDAQIQNAMGLRFLMVREKSGKFVRVGRDRAEKLNPNQEIIEVWEHQPSERAFVALMDRTIDRPVEHVEANVNSTVELTNRLIAGRKRVADARKRD